MDVSLFNPGQPYKVTAPGGQTLLLIKDRAATLPSTFSLIATRAEEKVALRVSGGCKGMNREDKAMMLEFFARAFAGFRGMIWSGGTRTVDSDGQIDPMVTDVPGVIASQNPQCIALGSCPRTDVMRLQGESQLVLDSYGTRPNPGIAALLIVQNGTEDTLDWDGDLDDVFGLMKNLLTYAGFTSAGVIAWNGGPITRNEVLRSARLGWPTIVIRGTGRACDDLARELDTNDPTLMDQLPRNHKLIVVDKNEPDTLRAQLVHFGFLTEN